MSIFVRVDNGHKKTLLNKEQGPGLLGTVNSTTDAYGLRFRLQPALVNQVCLPSNKNQIYATALSLC